MGLQSGVATLEPEQPGMQNGMVSGAWDARRGSAMIAELCKSM